MDKATIEPQVKASDELTVHEGLKALRETVESKFADNAENKEKVSKIETAIADIHEKQQKAFAEETEKRKAADAEILTLKNQYEALYKQGNRIGFGANDNDPAKMLLKNWAHAMDGYLRKGKSPSAELVSEMAGHLLATKSLINEDTLGFDNHKSLITGNSPDGGFFIIPDRRTDFEVERTFETSPMRTIARNITTTSNEVEIIVNDNEFDSGGWTGETQPRGDTNTPKVGTLMIAAHEQFAQPKASQKMLDDSSINIEQFIMRGIDDILTRTENTAFVSGDGSQKPQGFLTLPAWSSPGVYQRGALEQVNSGVDGVVKADGILKLQEALVERHQANAVFLMRRKTWGDVVRLKDGNGNYLIEPRMLKEGTSMVLLGKRVIFADDMQEVAVDSLSIAYGDFGVGYTIVDRLGIRVMRDPFTEKPFIKFYTTKRVGGAVTSFESIKIQKLAA